MATAEQIKSLIKAHYSSNSEQFFTIALQVAAHEARQGHNSLAQDIRKIVDKAKKQPVRQHLLNADANGLMLISEPEAHLSDIVLPKILRHRIERVLTEYLQQHKIASHGLKHRRKILLAGPPGTGKSMTASIFAGELTLPLYTVIMDKLVTKFMGETSAKLRQVFDNIQEHPGVYLFDEFDAIGGERSRDDDVGEMRRVLNSFLQFMERDSSDSLIIAATNNPKILDQALFRRFDDVLYYSLPDAKAIKSLIENRLGLFRPQKIDLRPLITTAESLSSADIVKACDDAIKDAIIANESEITPEQLEHTLNERKAAYGISA